MNRTELEFWCHNLREKAELLPDVAARSLAQSIKRLDNPLSGEFPAIFTAIESEMKQINSLIAEINITYVVLLDGVSAYCKAGYEQGGAPQ